MALTDTRPETGTADASVPTGEVGFPANLIGSGDHKVVGLVYVVLALLFGIAGWVVVALGGIHEIGDGEFLSDAAAANLFSAGRIGLVLLVAVPFMLGLATYIVPLQVGANTIAFPRAAAAALWTWLLSAGLFVVAHSLDGGLGGGRPEAVDMTLLAIAGMVLAIVIGTICVITTAVALRTPGLSLDRVPFFTWASMVAGSIWLLTLPVLVANLALVYVDHRYGAPSEFGIEGGQLAQVSWLVGQPQIYAVMIPGLGIIADVVSTLCGVRQANRGVVLTLIGAFAALSVGAWAQPYFYPEAQDQALYAGMAGAILLVTLLFVGGLAATVKAGKPSAKSPLGLAAVSALLLLLATVCGLLYVITSLELRDTGVYAAGLMALVVAAALTAASAGVMYWAPKMTGRTPSDAYGKLNVLVLLVGGALAGLPLVVLGFATKFDSLADAADALQGVAVAGDIVLAFGLLLTLVALVSTTRGASVGADAWGTGQTLEWACPSPPPPGNFGELAVVRSPEPLLDAAEPAEEA
jgi:heme/copper-type cytochrome/quinol oxidase subunit 1